MRRMAEAKSAARRAPKIRDKAKKRALMALVSERLCELYPDAPCALEYEGDGWKLLVMGRLSAQCTDARVNIVCKELFAKYPNCEAMAAAELAEIERIVRPCGLYKTKASSIKEASRILSERYGGEIPRDIDALTELPGVGRKIANLLVGDIYGLPAVVCDTHCIRICGRLGAYDESLEDPTRIEFILRELIDPADGSDFCHRIVLFGRETCTARSPRCGECALADICRANRKRQGK